MNNFFDFHVVSEFDPRGSEDSLNIQDQEGVGLLSVYLAVVEQNLPTAHNHVLQSNRQTRAVSVTTPHIIHLRDNPRAILAL